MLPITNQISNGKHYSLYVLLVFYYFVAHLTKVSDVGASMLVHVFGAYFGLMVSYVLQRNGTPEKESTSNTSDTFAVIGTVIAR